MRTALRTGALALAVAIGAGIGAKLGSLHARVEAQSPLPQELECGPNQGRFELVHIRYRPHGADGTAMIDTQTGRVWELATTKDGGATLEELSRSAPPAPIKLACHCSPWS